MGRRGGVEWEKREWGGGEGRVGERGMGRRGVVTSYLVQSNEITAPLLCHKVAHKRLKSTIGNDRKSGLRKLLHGNWCAPKWNRSIHLIQS